MFPLRSGLDTPNTPDPTQVMYQSIAASAMHEIGQQAILDCGLLMWHQQAAEIYYRQENGAPIPTNPDGTFNVYTPEERAQIERDLIDVVMKFHILDENGLANRLGPFIHHMQTQEPIDPAVMQDPFLQRVLDGHQQYSNMLSQNNLHGTLGQILDFSVVENIPDNVSTEMILNSYKDPEAPVDVAIFDDNSVQCACEFCEGFFQILEKMDYIDRSTLNPIQQSMLQRYEF